MAIIPLGYSSERNDIPVARVSGTVEREPLIIPIRIGVFATKARAVTAVSDLASLVGLPSLECASSDRN